MSIAVQNLTQRGTCTLTLDIKNVAPKVEMLDVSIPYGEFKNGNASFTQCIFKARKTIPDGQTPKTVDELKKYFDIRNLNFRLTYETRYGGVQFASLVGTIPVGGYRSSTVECAFYGRDDVIVSGDNDSFKSMIVTKSNGMLVPLQRSYDFRHSTLPSINSWSLSTANGSPFLVYFSNVLAGTKIANIYYKEFTSILEAKQSLRWWSYNHECIVTTKVSANDPQPQKRILKTDLMVEIPEDLTIAFSPPLQYDVDMYEVKVSCPMLEIVSLYHMMQVVHTTVIRNQKEEVLMCLTTNNPNETSMKLHVSEFDRVMSSSGTPSLPSTLFVTITFALLISITANFL